MVQCHWVYFFLLLALAIRGAFLNFIWNGSPSSETQLTALKCFESLLPWVCSNGLDRTFSFSCCLNDFRVGISSPALQHAKEGREGTVERKHIFFLCVGKILLAISRATPLLLLQQQFWVRDSQFLCWRSGSPGWVCQEEFYRLYMSQEQKVLNSGYLYVRLWPWPNMDILPALLSLSLLPAQTIKDTSFLLLAHSLSTCHILPSFY